MDGVRNQMACRLPGGFVDDDGTVHREVELIRLSGREEELLAGSPAEAPAATLVTEIISRCVRRIGAVRPVTDAVARRLLVADRQYLLLKLREATFGSRIEGTLACPWPHCGAKIDVDFSTGEIPVTGYEAVEATYQVELSAEVAPADAEGRPLRTITFRLPNGADQEALGDELTRNPARALTRLFERCLTGNDEEGRGADVLVERLSPRARQTIEQAMAARAPHLELEMDLTCPECGRSFKAPFDLQDFFFGEVRTSRDLLLRQVHYLAYHYHWSEREILEMPRDKRLDYIEVLADEIEAMNHAL